MNEKEKRVLIFLTTYSPLWGGAEIAIKEITDRLSLINTTKDSPLLGQRTVFCSEFCFDMITMRYDKLLPNFEKVGNINVYRISSSKLLFPFFAYFKALSLNRKNKYNIVWSMMAGRNAFSALFFKFTYPKTKYLLTLQEGDRLSYPKERIGFLWFFIGRFFKKIFTKADFIQVISEYLKNWAEDMGYKGEIEIVPNGADIEKFGKKSFLAERSVERRDLEEKFLNNLKNELGINKSEKVIITTSRLVEKNAIEDIIRALTFLPSSYKLLIAGTGELFYKLRKLTDSLQLTKRVLFLGNIKHSELPKYLHISDVFVRPSLSEGMGNSFIEAMASCVPVVATKVGGIPDFLEDGKTGLFCGIHDPRGIAEKVELFIKDIPLREKIIKNANKMVSEKYNWNLIAKDMKEKVFDKLETNYNKNILITTGIFPPDIGGPATYSKFLLEELPKYDFNVKVLSFGEVRHLPKIIRHFVYFLKILKRAKNTDIIFAQDPVSVGLPSVIASKIMRKKFLLKVVGDYAWEQMQIQNAKSADRGLSSAKRPARRRFGVGGRAVEAKPRSYNKFITPDEFQNKKFDFKTNIRKKIERWTAKRAQRIIVPSNYLKKIVSMWGVKEKNISVVYNGFKFNKDAGNKETIRKLLQFEGKLIISIGRLVRWKGFDTLIEIFPSIKNKFKIVKLIIVGSGPDKKYLQKSIDEKKLENEIALTGALSQDILLRYIKASDVFVLNTGYEGFSHQLLEVMDVGVPIVTTNVGGNTEIIEDKKNGLTAAFNDKKELTKAINKLLDNTDFADKIASQAKKDVQKFSEEKMIKNIMEILKTI